MSANSVVVPLSLGNCVKISKWKVKEGTIVSVGRVILLYEPHPVDGRPEIQKLKATAVGTVRKLLAREGDVVQPGHPLLELEKCTHPTVMKDMCAECGADLRNEEMSSQNVASIPMVHSIPELKVNAEQAQILGKADEERLLATKKLVLLVDLDQTLIHTTNDNIPSNLKDVCHFQLYGSMSPWHHTRLRPGTHKFLQEMSRFYELHICTFGSRMYAHKIAQFLDPDGKFFSHRILSRDECVSANSKTANLKALFPCGDEMVCIIDDREDVWNFAPNLIHVKPYHFFQHTGDINAPPGLSKQENDDKGEYDFSCLGDGRKSRDIFRPTIKQEIQKDAMNLVTRKGNKESMGKEDLAGMDKLCTDKTSHSGKELNENAPDLGEQAVKPENELEEGEASASGIDDDSSKSSKDVNENSNDIERKSINQSESEDIQSATKEENKENKPETNQVRSNSKEEETFKKETELSRSKVLATEIESLGTTTLRSDAQELNESSTLRNKESETSITSSLEDSNKSKVDEIEVEDHDDYLLYLEEILKRIHKEFYDGLSGGHKPDMKNIIPAVRKKVLAGANLVFSGLVPNHVPLEKSRAYQVAYSLGASVTQDLKKNTTHLVAVRPGTAKVNSARRMKNVQLVTADWLWVSAERWERVDEKVFPLGRNRAGTRHPPAHCGSPEHTPLATESQSQATTSSGRNRTASGRFMDTINPLLSFSSADIADMDQEVDMIFDESESDGEGEGSSKVKKNISVPEMESESEESQSTILVPPKSSVQGDSDSSSSSADSLSGEYPHGWGKHDLKRKREEHKPNAGTATESDGDEDAEDMPSTKFRRGEGLPSDLDLGENDSESPPSEDPPDPDDMDDGDWNMMGAALEREFLS